MKYQNKKVTVTGGLGFIGFHIVGELCQENLVVFVDNESTGNIDNIKHSLADVSCIESIGYSGLGNIDDLRVVVEFFRD